MDSTVDADAATLPVSATLGSLASLLASVARAARVVPAVSLAPGTILEGCYRIEEILGAGGMGIVYAARDLELGRRVAIKVHGRARGDDATRRLLREASAMAQLSHPNVVAVHHVGTVDGHVYVVMEYVAGTTLGRRMREAPMDWRAALTVLLQAGAGLAAAHRAGLVHRDFKPDNVLLGDDGRVCVADFGLARSASAGPGDDGASGTASEEASGEIPAGRIDPLSTPLTAAGAVVGTPAYMAPEQLRGAPVDERADLFAFCASLYEAACGARPFGGDSPAAILDAIRAGAIAAPRRRVPRWLRRVLVRNLAHDPAARDARMDVVLAALRPERRRRRTQLVALGMGLALAAGGGAWLARTPAADPCAGAGEPMRALWSPAARERLAAALAADGEEVTAGSVLRLVDEHGARWQHSAVASCRVAHAGARDAPRRARSGGCLARGLRQARALRDLLVAGKVSAGDAVRAVARLPDPRRCNDEVLLAAPIEPPEPAIAAQVDEVRARLDESLAARLAGRGERARELAERALTAARATGYRPVIAEALDAIGRASIQLEDPGSAAAHLADAFFAARAAGDDILAARAAAQLVFAVGYQQQQHDAGLQWARHARAEIERLGHEREAELTMLGGEAAILDLQGDLAGAAERLRRASALADEVLGPEHPTTFALHGNLAAVLQAMGALDEAEAMSRRVLAGKTALYGPDHVELLTNLGNLGLLQTRRGDHAAAVATQQQALAIARRARGAHSHAAATAQLNLGVAHHGAGALEQAERAFGEAAAMFEQLLGPAHADVIGALGSRASVLLDLGRTDEAIALGERTLEAQRAALGPAHPDLAHTHHNLAEAYGRAGAHARAVDHARAAVAIFEAASPTHPALLQALTVLGKRMSRAGDTAGAMPILERAVAVGDAQDLDPRWRAMAQLELAHARLASGGDRQRALDEARAAVELAPGTDVADSAAEWLRGAEGER